MLEKNQLVVRGIDSNLILEEYKNTNWHPIFVLPMEVHFIKVKS